MNINLTTATGKASKTSVELSDAIMACDYNESLIHQVVTAFLAGARSGTVAQKTRSEVRGGGAKPWRQKGTGRARAGTSRSPLWRSGGITFAAKPRDYSQKVNRKMYRGAMRSIMSELLRQERLLVVEKFTLDAPKTKALAEKLKALGVSDVLIITEADDDNLMLSARNLGWTEVCTATEINPLSLVAHENVVITKDAIKIIEERLAA